MTWVAPLPWPKPPLSLNDRLHWRVKADKVKQARRDAGWAIRAARLPRYQTVHVLLHYRAPDQKRRDLDNMAATLKPVLDALVDAGVIPDDDYRHVLSASSKIHEPDPRARQGLWVELYDGTLHEDGA